MVMRAVMRHGTGVREIALKRGVDRFRGTVAIALLWLLMLAGCGESGPPDLRQAADALAGMMKPVNLSRSMFVAAFPDGKASQYVSYLFSTMGSAEWPPSEEWADEVERQQMQAIGQAMWPAGVAAVPRVPEPTLGRQLVIDFDDERNVVIAYAYVDPADDPVFAREWKLPSVEPAIGVKEIYQSNLDLGMSPQSFSPP